MTLQYCSDLHLEFPENKEFLRQHPLRPEGDILVLAGDIIPFYQMDKHKDFFSYVSDHFKYTYWLPGNHEYYHSDISKKCGVLDERIKNNVFLVNNTAIKHDGLRLIFSTLWSKISAENEWYIEQGISDFHVIRHERIRFSAMHFNALHNDCRSFIMQELTHGHQEKTVVVTHHVPTFLNYPQEYRESLINEAFVVELHDLIKASDIDYWIYGHHHNNIPGFNIGNTLLVTNQLGYVKHGEHRGFNPAKLLSN